MPPREAPVLTFFTTNPGKLKEVQEALAAIGWKVVQGHRQVIEPQAEALEDVATSKLDQVANEPEDAVMVEDAGLFVRALNGFPGVYSAHVLRTLGVDGVLKLMEEKEDRAAEFRAVVGLRYLGRDDLFVGTCAGHISREARGDRGFGFDPIFVPEGAKRTFAEMTVKEKLARSHRGKAVQKLANYLGSVR